MMKPRQKKADSKKHRGAAANSSQTTAANEHAAGELAAVDVAFTYGKSTAVLERVSTEVVPGSFLAVLGVNGCGKSTLMACLDGMLHPKRGNVTLDDLPLSEYSRDERARRVALVAQHSHANRLTVYDALMLGRKSHLKSAPREDDHVIVEKVIDDLGLRGLALRYTDELSGGEYQKVLIGRALVQDTDILLLDEPTNNLDPANQNEVMRLVRNIVDSKGIAAAAVLHDLNLALRYCDRFLMIKDGEVCSYGGVETVTPASVHQVYDIDVEIIEHRGIPAVVVL